ncbi:MAG: hypothetical protein A2W77_07555 [Nitrospinae bacterium RIFCSPLOWO2_12_39_16]|nr:MAG: hypothetical protein A2W77_07555 [Nitrospinae bacterium RIFCSPLOWO2_12_39_16]
MKTATAKEFIRQVSAILEDVRKGEEITIIKNGESIAILKPFRRNGKQFNPVGFGMWKDRKDLKDVIRWIIERRKERFQR